MRRCFPERLRGRRLLSTGEWERCGSCPGSDGRDSDCIAALKALSGTFSIFARALDVLTCLIVLVGGWRSDGGVDLRHSIQLLDHSPRERVLSWSGGRLLELGNVMVTGGWQRLSVGAMHCSRLCIGERLVWLPPPRHFGVFDKMCKELEHSRRRKTGRKRYKCRTGRCIVLFTNKEIRFTSRLYKDGLEEEYVSIFGLTGYSKLTMNSLSCSHDESSIAVTSPSTKHAKLLVPLCFIARLKSPRMAAHPPESCSPAIGAGAPTAPSLPSESP